VVVWGAPSVSEEVLTKYRPEKTLKTSYSIEDHQYLFEGSEMYGTVPRDLFDVLRKEIIALDEAVTEEFLKYYVAYKAETNFVDIVPQAQGLLLSINTRGGELMDPKEVCKDVSNVRKIANGDFEMRLTSAEDIPYAIGLIRQALELQLGGE
jgi:predicted transport protein